MKEDLELKQFRDLLPPPEHWEDGFGVKAMIGGLVVGQILSRIDNFGLGYVMYRLTSDVEKLPFPMAPVGALGVTALADASGGQDTWRWRVFSFGAILGAGFATVYLALPAITGAFLPE